MRDAHSTPSSGHLGVEKTYDRIAREYYWKGKYHDVNNFVRACEQCQKYKVVQTGAQGLMGSRIVERPWIVVAADLMEFPPSKSQMKHLIKSVARALEELILFRWEFDNQTLRKVLEEYGVKHVTTPPYHPQANPVERSNRTLKTMISAFVGADHRNWDVHIHELRHAINTAIQATTRISPAFLNFGRHTRPVKSLRREIEGARPILRVPPEVWIDRIKRLDALRDLVARHIDQAREKQTREYNKNKRDVQFSEGDLVMRRTHPLSSGINEFSAKLAPKYEGPLKIVENKSPTVYVLENVSGDTRRIAKVHVWELKRYIPPRAAKNIS